MDESRCPMPVELFGNLVEVVPLPGREIKRPPDLQEADVLLVRSVTRVNEAL